MLIRANIPDFLASLIARWLTILMLLHIILAVDPQKEDFRGIDN